MSKQTVNIGTSANDGTGDPLRTAFDKTNDNFIELYNALGGDDVVNLINNDEEIELLATANKISFLYSTETQLLDTDANSHHGCIAHAHDTGALYYAHGGEWRKVLTDNANTSSPVPSYSDSLNRFVYEETFSNTETDGYILQTNANGTYAWAAPADVSGAVDSVDELTDTNITNLQPDQILKYNGSNWVNANEGSGVGGGSSTFTGLTDTPGTLGSAGQFIKVNSAGNALEFTAAPSGGGGSTTLDGLSDVNASSPSSGQVLKYNGSEWAPAADATGGGGGTLSRTTDTVATSGTVNNQADADMNFDNVGSSFMLMKVQVSHAVWFRIYVDNASRTADSGRTQGDDIADGEGLIAEFISNGADTFDITPAILAYSNQGSSLRCAIKNDSGSAQTLSVTLTGIILEA